MRRPILSLLAASAAFLAVAHAQSAQAEPPRPVVVVSAGDLRLDTEHGARTMLRRLEAAATKVCGGWPTELDRFAAFKTCYDQMLVAGVKATGAPLVSLSYAEAYTTNEPTILASR